MKFLSIYMKYVKMFIKSKFEYRLSFLLGIFVNFFDTLISYISLWVILNNFNTIAGWDFYEIAILYGMFSLTHAVAGMFLWYTMNFFDGDIITGNLDTYLIRPMGLLQQMVCRRFGETYIGQIVVILGFMIYSFVHLEVKIHVFTWIYFAIALISGTLIHASALILIGCLNFWTLGTRQLANILYDEIGRFAQYPLGVFPAVIKITLTYILPWALVNYYPCIILLGKVQTQEELIMGLLSPVIGCLLFGLSLFVFDKGVRRYSGSGG